MLCSGTSRHSEELGGVGDQTSNHPVTSRPTPPPELLPQVLTVTLTHVGDPNGHPLVHEVEDHDDDEVDAGGGDGGGELRCDERAHHMQVVGGAVLHDAGEGRIHRQAVGDHPDDAGDDERDLGGGRWTGMGET